MGARIVTCTNIKDEIRRAGLRVVATAGGGDCLFHAICKHCREFGADVDDRVTLRRRVVDFLLTDDYGKQFAEVAFDGEEHLSNLYTCDKKDILTWPPPECCFAISQLVGLKITLFITQSEGAVLGIQEYWPAHESPPEYPPVPSAKWACLKYTGDAVRHFELLLKSRKRVFPSSSYVTPAKK